MGQRVRCAWGRVVCDDIWRGYAGTGVEKDSGLIGPLLGVEGVAVNGFCVQIHAETGA